MEIHIEKDYPFNWRHKRKEKTYKFKYLRNAMMAATAWGESESEQLDEEDEEEEATQLCLMTHPSDSSYDDIDDETDYTIAALKGQTLGLEQNIKYLRDQPIVG
ncbi:hypothetical protein Ancab_005772 [Ancistrocladus abbreviatus]